MHHSWRDLEFMRLVQSQHATVRSLHKDGAMIRNNWIATRPLVICAYRLILACLIYVDALA